MKTTSDSLMEDYFFEQLKTLHKDIASLRMQIESMRRQRNNLCDTYPNWRNIVGAPTSSDCRPNKAVPFRRWLARQPAGYRTLVEDTNDTSLLCSAITAFLREEHEKPAGECRWPASHQWSRWECGESGYYQWRHCFKCGRREREST